MKASLIRIELKNQELDQFDYKDLYIDINKLEDPINIKDEGDFFSIFLKDSERIDIPLRFYQRFIAFLIINRKEFDSEIDYYQIRE